MSALLVRGTSTGRVIDDAETAAVESAGETVWIGTIVTAQPGVSTDSFGGWGCSGGASEHITPSKLYAFTWQRVVLSAITSGSWIFD